MPPESEELDSAMSERKLALARTIQLLNSQCERRLAGESHCGEVEL